MYKFSRVVLILILTLRIASTANILMITMAGTKSHKVPFLALAKGLIPRGHQTTFLNGFASDSHVDGLVEVTPRQLVNYIENYTNWDLVGSRYAGKAPVTLWQALRYPMEYFTSEIHKILQKQLDASMPHPYELMRNVSFILQNGYTTLTYARPYQPNVMEIACIHCHPPAMLPHELEIFIETAPAGIIFFSMGSSVRAANMPEELRQLLLAVFSRLPQYHVLWKWEEAEDDTVSSANNATTDIPKNVRLYAWLPQQDILGHRKLKAFIKHGGLHSMYEAIYHVAPMVILPVFCDHDVNAAKAAADGYALRLPLEGLTANHLYNALQEIIQHNAMYKRILRQQRDLLLDQMQTPLEKAVFWTEYVLRHKGATHLRPKEPDLNFFVRHSLDVIIFLSLSLVTSVIFSCFLIKLVITNSYKANKLKMD